MKNYKIIIPICSSYGIFYMIKLLECGGIFNDFCK